MASGVVPEIETERLLMRERAERKLTTYRRGWERQPVPYMGWVITTKADRRLIGLCEVSSDGEGTEGEVGYFRCPACWRQGCITEAARAAVRYAFDHTTWDHIVGTVAPVNVASVRVLEHLGFVREKEMSSQDYGAVVAAVVGDPTYESLEWPVPTLAIYTLRRDQFVPGDAFYRLHDAPPS